MREIGLLLLSFLIIRVLLAKTEWIATFFGEEHLC